MSHAREQDRNLGSISRNTCVKFLWDLDSAFHFEGSGNHKHVDEIQAWPTCNLSKLFQVNRFPADAFCSLKVNFQSKHLGTCLRHFLNGGLWRGEKSSGDPSSPRAHAVWTSSCGIQGPEQFLLKNSYVAAHQCFLPEVRLPFKSWHPLCSPCDSE